MNSHIKYSEPEIPIAIIGMSCIFPMASDLKSYWKLLINGIDAIGDVPETHWLKEDYFDQDPKKPDHVYCTRGGFLLPISFDPSEFGIPPALLEATDTSQLLSLVAAKNALYDAGYGDEKAKRGFNRDKTSVILGITGTQELVIPLGARLGHPRWKKALSEAGVDPHTAQNVMDRIADSYVSWQENSFPGLLGNVVAGRICNRLDLRGTNCVVDAACASSLGAVHLSVLELASGRSDMVITGGADTINDIFMHMCFSRTQILSPTGDIRPFSAKADGTVLGEGIGMIVLKRLPDAKRDGDRIYAVIKGLGTSSDGRSQSIYSPRIEGQETALKRAYAMAGFSPETVEMIEAHGTGTRVGDEAEFEALKKVFGSAPARAGDTRIALGTVKSNIGHTKAAAGTAGLIKAALSLYHKTFVPTLKVEQPDPKLNIEQSPFYLSNRTRSWFSNGRHPRRAGVSSFGFGGSNFHIAMEEYGAEKSAVAWDGSVEILPFSAPDVKGLTARIETFRKTMAAADDKSALSVNIAKARHDFSTDDPYRTVIVLDFKDVVGDRIRDIVDHKLSAAVDISRIQQTNRNSSVAFPHDIFFGSGDTPGKVAFLFPGQGSQYINMGSDIVCRFPEAFNDLQQASEAFGTENRLTDFIYPFPGTDDQGGQEAEEVLRQTHIAQPAIGAMSIGLYRVLDRFGIRPHVVCGHSLGELSALWAAGWINTETFFRMTVARGRIMGAVAADKNGHSGAMLAIRAPISDIEAMGFSGQFDVVLANRNSPMQGVVSGDRQAIGRIAEICRAKGFQAKQLPVSTAFHSRFMDQAAHEFADVLEDMKIEPKNMPVYSNVTADLYPKHAQQIKKLLSDQIRNPVNFIDMIENIYGLGVRTFVEVGPKNVLTGLVKSIFEAGACHAVPVDSGGGKASGMVALARSLGFLAAVGIRVDLTAWEETHRPNRKPLMNIPICGANHRSTTASKKPISPPCGEKEQPKTVEKPKRLKEEKVSSEKIDNQADRTLEKEDKPLRKHQIIQSTPNRMNDKQMKAFSNDRQTVTFFQKAIESMQALALQTTHAHKKFLETQTEANRTLRRLIKSAGVDADSWAEEKGMNTASIPADGDTGKTPPPSDSHALSVEETTDSEKTEPDPIADDHIPDSPVTDVLLQAVSHLTGYPVDMLELDMDIEADLGIDSIKRVEILSAIEEQMPDLPPVTPEIMGTLKTLRQILQYLDSDAGKPDCKIDDNGNKKEKNAVQDEKKTGTDASFRDLNDSSINTGNDFAEHEAGDPAVDKGISDSRVSDILLQAVSQLTGYPMEMLELDMDIEADLGIDSIKRVEILSAIEEQMPELPPVTPDIMGTLKTLGQILQYLLCGAGQAENKNRLTDENQDNRIGRRSSSSDAGFEIVEHEPVGSGTDDRISDILLEAVSHMTGYPMEMLELDMDIEADLGIDSIKRVEILSAVEEKMPELPSVTPEVMGTLKTLRQILQYLSQAEAVDKNEPLKLEADKVYSKTADCEMKCRHEAGDQSVSCDMTGYSFDGSNAVPERRVVIKKKAPLSLSPDLRLPCGRTIYIIGSHRFLGSALSGAFTDMGISSKTMAMDEFIASGTDVSDACGTIIIPDERRDYRREDLIAAFQATQKAGSFLMASAKEGAGVLATVSFLDGAFGFNGGDIRNPMQGGLAGLAKTASIEWPAVCCHAVDIYPDWTDTKEIAGILSKEILTCGPVEIGLAPSEKTILTMESVSYPEGQLNLTSKDVFVVTGGARGVTASSILTLLEGGCRPCIALIGRSAEPFKEPSYLKSINDAAEMKRVIMANDFKDDKPTPKQLEKRYAMYVNNRKIIENLNRFKSTGAKVAYYSADVTDSRQIKRVMDQIRSSFGPITGIIHGAGSIQDRLIIEKRLDQFKKVFDTKVLGMDAVLSATDRDPIRTIVIFSSVAARMGNKGQIDYAMANEVLNKRARYEAFRRPDCCVISINWGPWDGGMVTDALKREFEKADIELIPEKAGGICMVHEMMAGKSHPVEIVIGAGLAPAITADRSQTVQDHEKSAPYALSNKTGPLHVTLKREVDVSGTPILKSHMIDGKPVIPYSLMIEWLAHAALHQNPGLFFHGFDDIRIFDGIKLNRETRLIRFLTGKIKKIGTKFETLMEIRNGMKESTELVHLRAKAVMVEDEPEPITMRKRDETPLPGSDVFDMDRIYDQILYHGSDLKGIKRIVHMSEEKIVADVIPAPSPFEWMSMPLRTYWIMDPLMLDAAFQIAMVWSFENRGMLSIPGYIGSFRSYCRRYPRKGVQCVFETVDHDERKLKGVFSYYDESDRLIARINGYEALMDPTLNGMAGRNKKRMNFAS